MKIRSLIFRTLWAVILMSMYSNANAATECMFKATHSVDLTYEYDGKLILFDDTPPLVGFKQLKSDKIVFLPSSRIESTCNPGQQGQKFMSQSGNFRGPFDKITKRDTQNILLYRTTITGLYYGVNMFSTRCTAVHGFIPPNQDWVSLIDVGDDDEKYCYKTEDPYYFELVFFIDSTYKTSEQPIAFKSAVTSEHGKYMVSGSRGEKDEKVTTVRTVNINGQINHSIPRCSTWDILLKEMQSGIAQKNLIVTAQHRGDFTNEIPENSLGAFHRSYDRCRANVETDVRSTSDNKLVIFHDFKIGKMLEPSYDPRSNTGPNELLSNITLEQLKQKNLVNITTRGRTEYKVPTVDEMLQDYIDYNGQSLLYLETKSPSVVMPTALAIYNKSQNNPTSNLLQRAIIKVNMALYPSPDLWKQALIDAGLPSGTVIMIDPVITPNDASKINTLPDSTFTCPSGVQDSKAICSIRAWSNAPVTLAPMVSVLIKDSADFISTTSRKNIQGAYNAPANLNVSNTKNGTIAQMVAEIKNAGKAFEIFSSIPDYMFWKDLDFYTETVYDANIPADISVRNAFYNNDSSCCYQLPDKLKSTPIAAEKNDYRMNLGWLRDIGANVITADDTDSINTYYATNGGLDRTLTPSPTPPHFELQSLLAWQLGYAILNTELLANKGKSIRGTVYALYDGSDTWAWTYPEDPPIPVTKDGYSPYMAVKRVADGRVRIIERFHPKQCLWSQKNSSDWTWTEWKGGSNCADESSLWQMQPQGNKIYAYFDSNHMMMTWESSGKLYWGWKYGWVYTTPTPSTPSDWFYWKLK